MSVCSSSSNVVAIESQDRFTNLQNCLMSEILSNLPIKEAAKTCVLSKDWKYKWPSVCDIDIDSVCKSLGEDSTLTASFHCFLHRILEFNRDLRLGGFIIQDKSNEDRKTSWISKIVKQHVEDLNIVASLESRKTVSHKLFHPTEFELTSDCTWIVGVENNFQKLVKLCIRGKVGATIQIVNYQSLRTGKILLSFPVLIDLTLEHYEFLNVKCVEIEAPVLTSFTAYNPYNPNDYVIKMSAPKLNTLVSSGSHLHRFDLYTPSLSCMVLMPQFVSCEIDEKIVASRATTLFNRAPSLTCLTLSPFIVQAFVEWKKVHPLPIFDKLEHLSLFSTKRSMKKPALFDTKGLIELLQATPHLETLSLYIYDYDHVSPQEPLPPCIVSQYSVLKQINLFHFHGGSSQFGLMKLFIEKATKLERVVIYPCNEECSRTRHNIERGLFKLGSKLPRRILWRIGLTVAWIHRKNNPRCRYYGFL